jgi:hypothetical protein
LGDTLKPKQKRPRQTTHYSVYGRTLDVDALLAVAQPVGPFGVWRRGEENAIRHRAVTSGIDIQISRGRSIAAMGRAVLSFLEREERFLKAASRVTGPKVFSILSTGLFVHAYEPVNVYLPAHILRRLGRAGVDWGVSAYPCSD